MSETSGGNSLFAREQEQTTISVESFDFSQWLSGSFTEKDYVILSLDIEGAEFAVLEKMLQEETARLIDRLYVEFHPGLPEGPGKKDAFRKKRDRIRSAFWKLGAIVGNDSAEGVMKSGLWLDFII
jgi:hypothetical protein